MIKSGQFINLCYKNVQKLDNIWFIINSFYMTIYTYSLSTYASVQNLAKLKVKLTWNLEETELPGESGGRSGKLLLSDTEDMATIDQIWLQIGKIYQTWLQKIRYGYDTSDRATIYQV